MILCWATFITILVHMWSSDPSCTCLDSSFKVTKCLQVFFTPHHPLCPMTCQGYLLLVVLFQQFKIHHSTACAGPDWHRNGDCIAYGCCFTVFLFFWGL